MNNIMIICRKEIRSYFTSPIAYGLLAFFAFIYGWFFYAAVRFFVQRGTDMMMSGRGGPMDVNEWVIRPLAMNVAVINLFIIPMITMRLFAEEKRSGTIELLATSPIRDIEIILGKWFAAVILYACALLLSLFDVGLLFFYGQPEWKPILVSYLGLLLLGAALLAIGAFLSNTTRNQIVAGISTFAVCLILWVMDWMFAFDQSAVGKAISYISINSRLDNFSKGVLDTKDIIFYLSVVFFGLFMTARSMESLRLRS